MRDTELCMKYGECKFCPKNKQCNDEYNRYVKEKKRRQERKSRIKEKTYIDENN